MNKMLIFEPKRKYMAITKETFRNLIREGQDEIRDVELYERPFSFEENARYVLVGVRQAGKSYMLYQRAKQLLRKGHKLEEIIYIDFDDERLLGMKAGEFDLILQAYSSVYNYKPILFFDEIQNVDGWEHFARRLANQKYSVFITGSNAKMLSRDIQTTLGGRFIDETVFPYSFKEYVESRGILLEKEWQYGKDSAAVQQLFSQYLKWGGFPELMLYRNKRRWLNDLYEKILLGDVVRRNRVKNELAMRLSIKRLADNVMQPTSFNRLANLVKSAGASTTVASVISYVSHAKDACLLFSLDNYASKFVEKETIRKHYFTDNGLLSIFLTNGNAPLLENLCAIYLYKKFGDKVFFYNKNFEVDFYVPEESLAVQVAYTILEDDNTRDREVGALKKLNALHPLKRLIIITFDEEKVIELSGRKKIEVIPAWKWLAKKTASI